MKHWITYLIAALLTYSAIAHFRPTTQYSTKGIWLPITKRTQVGPLPTPNTRSVGWINLELHASRPSKAKQMAIITKAKEIAEKMGADRLVNVQMGFVPPSNDFGELAMYRLQAMAVQSTGAQK
jgi:hypothetical protein